LPAESYVAFRETMFSDTFAQNLRRLRKGRGLTQRELADLIGYTRAYISGLETGSFAASMAVLKKLAIVFAVAVSDLLERERRAPSPHLPPHQVAIINQPQDANLDAPCLDRRKGHAVERGLHVPGLDPATTFAAYLPDDSMAPAFSKGDLVVFSLTREPADGDACLVDTGKGEVVFRTGLALPGGVWRLQPGSPKFKPILVKAGGKVRMWPAIGRWQALIYRSAK
jgi:transcriptional regulator with XRE-family HTH domain